MSDPYLLAQEAAEALCAHFDVDCFDAFVVLGSGWGPAAETWPLVAITRVGQFPGFLQPVAVGHAGTVARMEVAGQSVLVFAGRTHLYEGHGPDPIAHPVRTAAAAGARLGILTNANGSLRPDWPVGTPLLIRDHLNLTAVSPLVGPRFVDLTDAWSPRLRALAADLADLPEVVYALLRGPQYETLAEAAWVRRCGADVLGMSTVLEAIAAREAGVELLGLTTVTAIEGSPDGIDPDEVVRIGEATARRLGPTIHDILRTTLGGTRHE